MLTDIRMPNVTGVEILAAARQSDPDVPVILMTAQATLQSAMQAVNEGAFYYIQKPFRNDELVAILRRAAEHRKLRVENKSLKQAIRRHERQGVARPVGTSKSWVEVLRLVETVAPTDSTVLIQGESGTGKEVIARYIHELSTRTEGPFLSINCGALPESLLESELFGHVKGSFTGAISDKVGLFGAATKGTFFLDEIGETTPATQVKLLRALQHREVIPVGSTDAVPVDTRVVAATNRDLDEEIRAGNFRSDSVLPARTSSRCICRRCASAATTFRCSPNTFSIASPEQRNEPPKHLTEAALGVMPNTRGPATCASSRTRSSARSFSRRATRSTSARFPNASPSRAPSRSSRRARRRTRRSKPSSAPTSCGCCRRRAATSRAPPKCSASIRRRCIESFPATESTHEHARVASCARARPSTAAPSNCPCSSRSTTSATRSISSSIRCARRRCRRRSSASTTIRRTARADPRDAARAGPDRLSSIAIRKIAARARRFGTRCR